MSSNHITPHIALSNESAPSIDDLDFTIPNQYNVQSEDGNNLNAVMRVGDRQAFDYPHQNQHQLADRPPLSIGGGDVVRRADSSQNGASRASGSRFGENYYSLISDDSTLPRPNIFIPSHTPTGNTSPPMPPRYPTNFRNKNTSNNNNNFTSSNNFANNFNNSTISTLDRLGGPATKRQPPSMTSAADGDVYKENMANFKGGHYELDESFSANQNAAPNDVTDDDDNDDINDDDDDDDPRLKYLAQNANGCVFVPPGFSYQQHSSPSVELNSQSNLLRGGTSNLGQTRLTNNRASLIGPNSDAVNEKLIPAARSPPSGSTFPNHFHPANLQSNHPLLLNHQTTKLISTNATTADNSNKYYANNNSNVNNNNNNDDDDVKFVFDKKIKKYVSWKCLAVILAILSFVLLIILCYFIGTYLRKINQSNSDANLSRDLIDPLSSSSSSSPLTHYVTGTTEHFRLRRRESWKTVMYVMKSVKLKIKLEAPRTAVFGIYGNRNEMPSHTRFEFFHPLTAAQANISNEIMYIL
ncbi:hypothetical protein HELRODRAFT_174954 [Helobdella robusta]|uniref:Teneurin-1-4-like galactose-binding domain-containing protein n=1 Tax=Helobdella robusta TaxID=6412 RepID=T1F8N3_HELRO|nr:hypothetical protein HELRODRAFT_174954 [Helobdella robusta]ESO01397.1 hypothetical protein HELRODRAFT_174954 [Helobdella robusta]